MQMSDTKLGKEFVYSLKLVGDNKKINGKSQKKLKGIKKVEFDM